MTHKRKRKRTLTRPFDVTLGLWLIGGGFLLALLASIYFAFLQYDLPLMLLVLPATLILLGLCLVFFDFVEENLGLVEDMARIPDLVSDDLAELRRFNITRTHRMVIGIPVLLAIQFFFFAKYDKWSADWGGINVLLIAVIVALIGSTMLIRTQWFARRTMRTPDWIITAVVFGFILSGGLGILCAEPYGAEPEYVNEEVRETSTQSYDYDRTRTGRSGSSNWFWLGDGWVSGGSCEDDACMFIVLFIVIVIVVMASAVIPHFWMVGTSLMIAVFLIQTVRELLYVGQDHPAHPWYKEQSTD